MLRHRGDDSLICDLPAGFALLDDPRICFSEPRILIPGRSGSAGAGHRGQLLPRRDRCVLCLQRALKRASARECELRFCSTTRLDSSQSGGPASAHKEMMAADESRTVACQVFHDVCDVFQRSHALHRAEGLHELEHVAHTLCEQPSPLDRGWQDRMFERPFCRVPVLAADTGP